MRSMIDRLTAGLAEGMAYVTALADETLQILWISPSVADLVGWAPDELVGRNAMELVHPDDLEGVARVMLAEQSDPHPYGTDPARRSVNRVRFLDSTGGWRALDIAANNQCHNPDVAGFVFIMSDTTAQRLLDAVYDSMNLGMSVHTTAVRVAELLSFQSEGALVCIQIDGIDGIDDVRVGSPVEGRTRVAVTVESGGEIAVEHDADREPSEWFVVLVERAARMLDIAITRHLGEQALRRRLDEKTAIISAVSHDLRSPIAAIHLMSSLLDGNGDALTPEQRRQLAQRISTDARRTSRLLADLTSIDRLLHGSSEMYVQRVVLHDLVERVLGDIDASDHHIRVASMPADTAARADPVLTERIVDNLVTNALKHTPVGSRIEVCVDAHGAHDVVVHVDDDGPGLPTATRASMFDAYVRGDQTEVRPGSGMGLFLVRSFAEVQGGRALVDVSPLGGARFSVVLPRWTG